MEAFGALISAVLLAFACFLLAVGFIVGYFVGRRIGRREPQHGFPVLPTDWLGDAKGKWGQRNSNDRLVTAVSAAPKNGL